MNFGVVEGQIRSKGSITLVCAMLPLAYMCLPEPCATSQKLPPPDSHNGLVVALCGICGGVVHKL